MPSLTLAKPPARRPGPPPSRPCGTLAALRRHQRRGERCEDCLKADRRAKSSNGGGSLSIDLRPVRNGIPETPGYQWRARAYPWAQRALAAAEAEHGSPDDCDLDDLDYLLRSGYAREMAS